MLGRDAFKALLSYSNPRARNTPCPRHLPFPKPIFYVIILFGQYDDYHDNDYHHEYDGNDNQSILSLASSQHTLWQAADSYLPPCINYSSS